MATGRKGENVEMGKENQYLPFLK